MEFYGLLLVSLFPLFLPSINISTRNAIVSHIRCNNRIDKIVNLSIRSKIIYEQQLRVSLWMFEALSQEDMARIRANLTGELK